ncbi:MAG: hypothetical protein KGL04_05590 [Elusimicrobia bacterium]|nr:hypothetical protein [Elusimicrobiota bacterium]
MGVEKILWFACLAVPPAVVLAAYAFGLRGRRFYFSAVACASLLVPISSIPLALELTRATTPHFGVLPIVLIPFAAFLWFLAVIVTPSGRISEAGVARTAAACLLEMAAFAIVAPVPLALAWIATSAILLAGHLDAEFAEAKRIIYAYLGLSVVLLTAGLILASWARGRDAVLEQCGIALILLAVMIRKGIFPFHSWIPEIFEHGRIGPAARFNAPQIGTYAALVLAVPYADAGLMKVFAALALVTAVYGSLMAFYQNEARKACGYLFVSQSALVVAGLDIPGRGALVGALILWICSGVALAGLSRAVLSLEARRGRLRLDIHHGGYERMPLLAVCFLLMSLAVANFPGTLGFIGGEMLVRGAVDFFPSLGFFAIIATAVNGLAAIRMYFSLFCGKKDDGAHLKTSRAENLGFAAAALFLIGFGLAPGGLAKIFSRAETAATRVEGALPR